MRTTVDLDDPILKDLKKIQQKEGKSLGRLISSLPGGFQKPWAPGLI
jgi:predicted DNA-binding ribbon-helix-helix protein